MQCGIACLKMVCKYYGKEYSYDYLSQICNVTNAGVSLLGMNDAAKTLGFSTQNIKLSLYELKNVSLPCILHWNQNHFVVLYKVKFGHLYYVADPAKGLVTYTTNEFKKHWIGENNDKASNGIAMLLFTTQDFYDKAKNKGGKNKNKKFSVIFKYASNYKKYFGQILFGLFVGSIIQLSLPFLTQSIVDIGIKKQDISFIYLILIGQFVLTLSHSAIDFIRRWLLLHISLRINICFVSDFFAKLLKLPMSFFDIKLTGDLMQRMSDHGRVNTFLTQHILNISFALFTFIIFSTVLCFYNQVVFTVFLFGSLLYGMWMTLFLKRRRIIDYELFEKNAINNDKTFEFITSIQEIKLQDCELRRRWEWEDSQTELFKIKMASMKLQQTQEAGSIFINELKNIIITVISATSVINGNMTLGMMLAIQYIIGQLNLPIEQIMNFIYSLQDVKISLERIYEIHNEEEENKENKLATSLINIEDGIKLNNVMFKYSPHSLHNTLNNININIPNGKITAIVGASGSGKTTIIKLLLGYYNVFDGDISIGNTDIKHLNKKWWRNQCGVVMQNGIIFSESIARNIAIDDRPIDSTRLLIASDIACLKDFILSLPQQFNTRIGRDGMELSQGQKQRILIARAVYKNPDYIFLDEATNSLDANNERMIVENLNKFYQGKTVIVVAHRLSTVKNADQIIVIDNGTIVEIGNHQELTLKQGAYYNLVKNQLELGN